MYYALIRLYFSVYGCSSVFFFFKQKTAYEMRISDWSSDVCSSDLLAATGQSRLLERNPKLDTSIRLRLPYIEPLNLLQVELMKRHRRREADPRTKAGIELSTNAIATALWNRGRGWIGEHPLLTRTTYGQEKGWAVRGERGGPTKPKQQYA